MLRGADNTADHIEGAGGDDRLLGFGGDDVLDGGTGDDSLGGGAGSDTLIGGEGNDVYPIGTGPGMDTLIDEASEDSVNIARLGFGLLPVDLAAERVGDDLVLRVTGTSHGATIKAYYNNPGAWQ